MKFKLWYVNLFCVFVSSSIGIMMLFQNSYSVAAVNLGAALINIVSVYGLMRKEARKNHLTNEKPSTII